LDLPPQLTEDEQAQATARSIQVLRGIKQDAVSVQGRVQVYKDAVAERIVTRDYTEEIRKAKQFNTKIGGYAGGYLSVLPSTGFKLKGMTFRGVLGATSEELAGRISGSPYSVSLVSIIGPGFSLKHTRVLGKKKSVKVSVDLGELGFGVLDLPAKYVGADYVFTRGIMLDKDLELLPGSIFPPGTSAFVHGEHYRRDGARIISPYSPSDAPLLGTTFPVVGVGGGRGAQAPTQPRTETYKFVVHPAPKGGEPSVVYEAGGSGSPFGQEPTMLPEPDRIMPRPGRMFWWTENRIISSYNDIEVISFLDGIPELCISHTAQRMFGMTIDTEVVYVDAKEYLNLLEDRGYRKYHHNEGHLKAGAYVHHILDEVPNVSVNTTGALSEILLEALIRYGEEFSVQTDIIVNIEYGLQGRIKRMIISRKINKAQR
jgi:hypothetical protein